MAQHESSGFLERLAPVARDAGRLLQLHGELLRSELRQKAGEITPAVASLGAGAGLAAAGGVLGSLAVVHALHRATRLPLWACYGAAGGLLGAAGVALLGSGLRRAAEIDPVPRETIATLKDDLEWAKTTTA